MYKTIFAASAAAAVLLISGTASAQSVMFELNGAHAAKLNGGELGVGYNIAKGNFRLTPIVGAFIYKGDNDRYASQTVTGGNTICRDLRNGQFAKKENCNNTAVKAYGKLEAAYRFGGKVEIGGGVRVSSKTTPYGSLGFNLSDQLALRAFGGDDYYGAGLIARF
jgi:hypothetical protein